MWPRIEACTGWVAELNSWVCLGQFFLSCSVCDIGDNILKIHFVSWRGLYQPKVSREDGLPSPSSMCAHHSLSVFLARVVHLLHMMNLCGNIIFHPKAIVPFRIPGIRRMFSAHAVEPHADKFQSIYYEWVLPLHSSNARASGNHSSFSSLYISDIYELFCYCKHILHSPIRFLNFHIPRLTIHIEISSTPFHGLTVYLFWQHRLFLPPFLIIFLMYSLFIQTIASTVFFYFQGTMIHDQISMYLWWVYLELLLAFSTGQASRFSLNAMSPAAIPQHP